MRACDRKLWVVLGVALGFACKDREGAPPAVPAPPPGHDAARPAPAAGADEGWTCTELPFPLSAPIAEASGAIWLAADGGEPASILLVGDSGTRGAYLRIDAETGGILEQGALALDR